MHYLILAERTDGHRLNYVKILSEFSLARGDRVTVALGLAKNTAEHRELYLGHLEDKIAVLTWEDFSPAGVATFADRVGADRVVDPDGDQLAGAIVKRLRWPARQPVTILIMRPEAQKAPFPGARRLLTLAKKTTRGLLARIRGVRLVVLVNSLEQNPKINEAPDPIAFDADEVLTSEFRQEFGLDRSTFWFAIVGAIDERKNVDLVARALSDLGSDVGLMIAGKVSAGAASQLESARKVLALSNKKIVVIDRLLSEQELDMAIAAADCVALAHSNEGASGIMGKAAAAGTRVLAAGASSLKTASELIPEHATWVPLAANHLRDAAALTLELPRPIPIPQENNYFAERLLS